MTLAVAAGCSLPAEVVGSQFERARRSAARRRVPLVAVIDTLEQARELLLAVDDGCPVPLVVVAPSGDDVVRALVRPVADVLLADDRSALRQCVELLTQRGDSTQVSPSQALELVPPHVDGAYDVSALLTDLVDETGWLPLAPEPCGALVSAVAQLAGQTVLVLANDPRVDDGRLDAAALRDIGQALRRADRRGWPVLSLVDTAGVSWADGRRATVHELSQVAAAWCGLRVPVIAVLIGRVVGLGAMAMGGVEGGAAFVSAWPRARFGVGTLDELAPVCSVAESAGVLDVIDPRDTRATVAELLSLLVASDDEGVEIR